MMVPPAARPVFQEHRDHSILTRAQPLLQPCLLQSRCALFAWPRSFDVSSWCSCFPFVEELYNIFIWSATKCGSTPTHFTSRFNCLPTICGQTILMLITLTGVLWQHRRNIVDDKWCFFSHTHISCLWLKPHRDVNMECWILKSYGHRLQWSVQTHSSVSRSNKC